MARNTSPPEQGSGAGDEDVTDAGGMSAVAPTAESRAGPSDDDSGRHVVYQGRATHRRITGEQWKAAGIEGQTAVEFNALNHYRLPTSDFTGSALEALRSDGSFFVPAR